MDEYGAYRSRETPLVRKLMEAGLKHGRAVSFERCLDDANFCGISGSFLAVLMDAYADNRPERISAPKDPTKASVSQPVPTQALMAFFESGKQADAVRGPARTPKARRSHT